MVCQRTEMMYQQRVSRSGSRGIECTVGESRQSRCACIRAWEGHFKHMQ